MNPPLLKLGPFARAVEALGKAVHIAQDRAFMEAQSLDVQEAIISGVIQRFEFTHELAVNTIRRHLRLMATSPKQVDELTHKDLLRDAARAGLIQDTEAWFQHRARRNLTSHTYDARLAQQVYEGATGFLADALALLDALRQHHV